MAEYGESLTERELELVDLLSTGVTNREIAYQLDISVNTVKVHLRNIYAKLGAESRTEATMIAVRDGLVVVDGLESTEEGTGEEETLEEVVEAPPPPLPWLKRGALILALLLAAAAVALTWPRGAPQAEQTSVLPGGQAGALVEPAMEDGSPSPWREMAQMPTRRAYMALAAVEGRLVAVGGLTPEGATGVVEIYDPAEDIWVRGQDKPTRGAHVSAAVIDGQVYLPGGCDDDRRATTALEVYDVARDSWHVASPLPEPRCAYAVAAKDGELYLFGGWDGARYVATTYVYDPAQDLWRTASPMAEERGLAAAAVLDQHIYVVGGDDGERELPTCAFYAPQTNAWHPCAPLTIRRGGLGLVAMGGRLYAVGGGVRSSYLGFINEWYDPVSDAWQPVETPLTGEWRSPGVAVLDQAIYAVGGWSAGFLSVNHLYEPFPFRIFIPASQQ
jgi:DNA-binding CsgD family transcriptional regulator